MSSDTTERRPEPACGVCCTDIDDSEVFISATCHKCGASSYHVDCLKPFMFRIHHDSTQAKERARHLIETKPHYLITKQRMRCPCPDCDGRIKDADMVKPAEPPPPTPTPGSEDVKKLSASRPGRKAKKASPGGAAQPQNGKSRAEAGVAASPALSRQQIQQQQRDMAAAARAVAAPRYAAASANDTAANGSSSGDSNRAFGSGKMPLRRPVELQLCPEYEDYGECRIYRCPRCHGKEELHVREQHWLARQEAKKRERRQQELDEHERRRAQRAEQAQWVAQVSARELEALEHEEQYLQMTDAVLRLMKDHKRNVCIASLIDMGFDGATAAAASDAAGCDVSVTAALVMEGVAFAGTKPVSVTGEAQELLAYASSLGLGLSDVEVALVLSDGDSDAAQKQLHQRAEQQAAAASAVDADKQAEHAAAAAAREEAELAAALRASATEQSCQPSAAAAAAAAREEAELAAALRASASCSAISPQNAAAAAAAAAREEAELAAAIEASKADAQRRQGAVGLHHNAPPPSTLQLSNNGTALALKPQSSRLWGPPPGPGSTDAGQNTSSFGWHDTSVKQQMPQHASGWDVGLAAVPTAAVRPGGVSVSLPQQPLVPAGVAAPAPDPWQQQTVLQQLPGPGLSATGTLQQMPSPALSLSRPYATAGPPAATISGSCSNGSGFSTVYQSPSAVGPMPSAHPQQPSAKLEATFPPHKPASGVRVAATNAPPAAPGEAEVHELLALLGLAG